MLEIYQIITTVNAETFDLYAKNMGQRMLQHITDADMVVFNRATEETRQLIRDRNVRSMNRRRRSTSRTTTERARITARACRRL